MPEGEEVRSIPGQNVSPGAQGLEVKEIFSLCLAKTLHNRRINDLEEHLTGALFAMIP
jgi:hypothetical protein